MRGHRHHMHELHELHELHKRGHRRHGVTLHRALFMGSFVSILATAACVIAVTALTSDAAWWTEMQRAQRFVSATLARSWSDEAARTRLLNDAVRDLDMRIEVVDPAGNPVFTGGRDGDCGRSSFRFDVAESPDAPVLARVTACRPGARVPPWRGVLAIGSALSMLWVVSALFARRFAQPIRHLVDVAKKIGDGDLRARPTVSRRAVVEVRALADAIAEMAERIEGQLRDQRALLAGASHEMRTPLGHLRILVELLRAQPADQLGKVIDDVEREVVEMDALIEKLLASSRLDFSLAEKRTVDAVDLARRALERFGEPADKLTVRPTSSPSSTSVSSSSTLNGDPTLLLGAIANVVENARSHGGALVRLTVELRDDEVAFVVDDAGPGIAPGDEEKVFEPFFHKAAVSADASAVPHGSLGLGLALVKRIAAAHGGRTFATTRAEGGGRVGFTAARK